MVSAVVTPNDKKEVTNDDNKNKDDVSLPSNVDLSQTEQVVQQDIASSSEVTDGVDNSILTSEVTDKTTKESPSKESEDTSGVNGTLENTEQASQENIDTPEVTDALSPQDKAKMPTDTSANDSAAGDPSQEIDCNLFNDIMMKQPQKDLTREQLQQIIAQLLQRVKPQPKAEIGDDQDNNEEDDDEVFDESDGEQDPEKESTEEEKTPSQEKSPKAPKKKITVKKATKKSLTTKPKAVSKRRTKKLKLKRGTMITVARMFGVHPSTISRIWNRACDSYWTQTNGADIYESASSFQVIPQKKFKTGRKPKWNPTEIRAAIAQLPDGGSHQSLRQLAAIVHVPYTTLHRLTQRKPGEPLLPPTPNVTNGEDMSRNDSKNTYEENTAMEDPSQCIKEENTFETNSPNLKEENSTMQDSQTPNDESFVMKPSPKFDEEHTQMELPQVPVIDNSVSDALESTILLQEKETSLETLPQSPGITTMENTQFSNVGTMPDSNCAIDDSTVPNEDNLGPPPSKRICVEQQELHFL